MPENAREVRVFVSSPGDVLPERGRVDAVAAKLNIEYESLAQIKTVLWEESFYKADSTFQSQIPQAAACDIVLSIFWTTVGTELPAEFARMPDGRPYPSGTAYELLTALEASRTRGIPDVYVFRKTADAALPTADAERRRQAQAHLDALEAFWSEWFKSEKGQFKAAFQSFANPDAFEQQLEELLRQWLQSHDLLGPRLAWPREKGSPFRGLAPFEAEHTAVFFGRSRAIDEARRRLVAAEQRGTPFLLIVGASGSGKSSLVRAGVIPRLTTPGVVASIDVWRVARMKPSDSQAGPLQALATALFAEGALPELSQSDFSDAAALANNFDRGGEVVTQPILRALQRVGAATQQDHHTDRPLQSALLLLVDQFEELFAKGVSDSVRSAFAETLKQLLATRRIWIVATLRADLYEHVIREPTLKALKEAGASFDLGLPGPAELADIVRAPAHAAGLTFESDPAKGPLDDRLLADAKNADSLPLLQFTLQHLYERRVETENKTQLTHKAYDALGGLEGAIAAEAERAVAGLKPEAAAALPRLLRRLAESAHDGTALTLREISRRDVEADPSEVALLDALLAARILIARTDVQGQPTVRLAHNAVFVSWPRAKDAAQANRDFYRVRAEAEDALRLWQTNGRPNDRLIQPGVPLAEAEDLVRRFDTELSASLIDYVRISRHRARRRQRFERAAAVFFFALAVTTTVAGVWAYRAQREAFVERDRAAKTLETLNQTGNSLVYDLGTEAYARGVPKDLMGRMLDGAIQGYNRAIQLDQNNAAAYISRGFAYMVKGDNDRALQDFNQGIQLDPKNAAAYRNRGVAYGNKGDNDRAFQNFDQAIQLDPKDSVAYITRGTAYASKGDNDRAIQDFNLVLQQDPTNAAFYFARGNAYKNKGDYDRAIQDYDHGIRLNSNFPIAYTGRGDAYRSKGDYDRAIQDYDQAIRLAPDDSKNASAYTGRGFAYMIKGDNDRALQDFEQAIRLDPKNAIAYLDRGLAYQSMGNQDHVIQDYDQAIQLDPKNANAYIVRGNFFATTSDPDRAIQDYGQAIGLDPKNANAYAARGGVYADTGDPDRAIQDLDQAIQLDPRNIAVYIALGAVYARKGDNDRAIKNYDEAIKLDPKNVPAHLGRGEFYAGFAGNQERAIQDYNRAIEIDPKNSLAFVDRGNSYASTGDPDRAIEDFDQAIRLDPKNAAAYSGRGDAYTSKSDYDRAIQDYDQAIQLGATNSAVYSNRGRAFFYVGNFEAAAESFLRATELDDDAYSVIWRYLARQHGGEKGEAELAANAERLKSKDWPYPVIEMYLGQRLPAAALSAAHRPEDRCEAQFYIGEWYIFRGDSVAAAAAFRDAAATCPKDFNEYAGALAELKRLNR
jgi:tetratricopeptide (TPR) repeat protein